MPDPAIPLCLCPRGDTHSSFEVVDMKADFKETNGTQGSKCLSWDISAVYKGEIGSRKVNMWVFASP